jgi:hypothetical protein
VQATTSSLTSELTILMSGLWQEHEFTAAELGEQRKAMGRAQLLTEQLLETARGMIAWKETTR